MGGGYCVNLSVYFVSVGFCQMYITLPLPPVNLLCVPRKKPDMNSFNRRANHRCYAQCSSRRESRRGRQQTRKNEPSQTGKSHPRGKVHRVHGWTTDLSRVKLKYLKQRLRQQWLPVDSKGRFACEEWLTSTRATRRFLIYLLSLLYFEYVGALFGVCAKVKLKLLCICIQSHVWFFLVDIVKLMDGPPIINIFRF